MSDSPSDIFVGLLAWSAVPVVVILTLMWLMGNEIAESGNEILYVGGLAFVFAVIVLRVQQSWCAISPTANLIGGPLWSLFKAYVLLTGWMIGVYSLAGFTLDALPDDRDKVANNVLAYAFGLVLVVLVAMWLLEVVAFGRARRSPAEPEG